MIPGFYDFVISSFWLRISGLVPQRFTGLQHMLYPFLGLPFTAQTEKRLPLQIQEILLGDEGSG